MSETKQIKGAIYRPISELHKLEGNPRIIRTKQFETLVKSIRDNPDYFEARPLILSDRTGELVIIAGNQRYEAARVVGLKEVPTFLLPGLTEAKERELVIRDNVSNGEWDYDALANFWDDLPISEWGVEIPELDDKKKVHAVEDDFEIPEVITTDIVPGDLFEFHGNGIHHRLLCGDAMDPEVVIRLMNGMKADCVFTDPPYNVNYSGRGKETSNKILNDHMSEESFMEFLTKVFENYKLATKESAPFYICHSSSSQILFEQAMRRINLIVKNQIIWNKTVASMGWGDYRWKNEPLFYATFGKKAVNFFGDRSQYTVWNESWDIIKIEKHLKRIATKQEKGGSTVWTITRESKYQHPTQKPVELISIALENSSKSEDIVLDFFGGSGSTMVTGHQLRRNCYTLELDPRYVQVMADRMRALDPLMDITRNGEKY